MCWLPGEGRCQCLGAGLPPLEFPAQTPSSCHPHVTSPMSHPHPLCPGDTGLGPPGWPPLTASRTESVVSSVQREGVKLPSERSHECSHEYFCTCGHIQSRPVTVWLERGQVSSPNLGHLTCTQSYWKRRGSWHCVWVFCDPGGLPAASTQPVRAPHNGPDATARPQTGPRCVGWVCRGPSCLPWGGWRPAEVGPLPGPQQAPGSSRSSPPAVPCHFLRNWGGGSCSPPCASPGLSSSLGVLEGAVHLAPGAVPRPRSCVSAPIGWFIP